MSTILRSLAMIIAIGAIAGGATFAYFSDTENTGENLVTTGTLNLELGEAVDVPMLVENAFPGMQTKKTFDIENQGSISGHVRVGLVDGSVVDSENGWNDAEMADEPDVATNPDNGELCDSLLVDIKNLDTGDILAINSPFSSLATAVSGNVALPGGEKDTLEVTFKIPGSINNQIQSDKCGANFAITLIQDVDQDGIGDDDDLDYPNTF